MEAYNITPASVEDYKSLQLIGKETFSETFASSNTEENMEMYLSKSFSDEKMINELSNKESMFFIAWDKNVPIGYLKVNTGEAQTELQDPFALEIERIYVKASYHGKKIGQLLYDKALEVAHQKDLKSIWLGVWEENPRAIKFYEKNGFLAFDKHVFKMGDDMQTDIMMRKILG
ncbi:GNAT family N-acetyltransferase [Pedobacter jejuensis]|uniref:GNAT family N-acetyltransferase n=1 Tax=Pedobacter jejuensis TaxID=1268550 RepID=A0A3N0C1V1_9SPHI|nr:GNAT family N-acetyltransferase [Pedobacter jejuensis]RNL55811.1 GNAT family N-acetyltransferase [Pedobacter jejuensis]